MRPRRPPGGSLSSLLTFVTNGEENGMNDYIQTPEGGRIRWLRPPGVENKLQVVEGGKLRVPGQASIDQWLPPEPPDAA